MFYPRESMNKRQEALMREQITDSLKKALKQQDKRRVSTLRLINAAIKDRDIAARAKGNETGVDEAEIIEILSKMIKQRRESAKLYEEGGRTELAEEELAEIEVIEGFLPQQLSEDEVAEACKALVEELGADGLKDMGRVMGALKERYAGSMDFGKASAIVKELLS